MRAGPGRGRKSCTQVQPPTRAWRSSPTRPSAACTSAVAGILTKRLRLPDFPFAGSKGSEPQRIEDGGWGIRPVADAAHVREIGFVGALVSWHLWGVHGHQEDAGRGCKPHSEKVPILLAIPVRIELALEGLASPRHRSWYVSPTPSVQSASTSSVAKSTASWPRGSDRSDFRAAKARGFARLLRILPGGRQAVDSVAVLLGCGRIPFDGNETSGIGIWFSLVIRRGKIQIPCA
jgi:hypothetical protein